MKNFFKSTAGKVILFVLTSGFLFLALAGIFSIYQMFDREIYSKTLEEVTKEYQEQIAFKNLYHLDTREVETNIKMMKIAYEIRYSIVPIVIFSGIYAIIGAVLLMSVAGRRKGNSGLSKRRIYQIPLEIIFIILLLPNLLMFGIAGHFRTETAILIFAAGIFDSACSVLFFGYIVAVHMKKKSLQTYTVFYHLAKNHSVIWRGIKNYNRDFYICLPDMWKEVIAFVILILVELVFAVWIKNGDEKLFILWFAVHFVLFIAGTVISINLCKLKRAGEELAKGNTDYKTEVTLMLPGLRRHGENLNHISEGVSIAVDEKMKSERMKTELITNVSHDIKTPLTSIINYADLIGKESTGNDAIVQYTEVLSRQSNKLKRLIEDLVEASKASTGNLDISMTACDANIFLTQIVGEFKEKLEACQLTALVKGTDVNVKIMADGRRMFRVFDNLMNNICKYAKEGTRVYLTLEEQEKDVIFTFKNISREELNIAPEELMERFVRGDKSRNTEGNGLGLAIARSLTELQKGRFEVYIDGDLFKVILRFTKLETN